jgi:hypothetical protein
VHVLTPAAAPTVILALGRWWHAEGAAHSLGDAALMGVLAAGAAACGLVTAQGEDGGELPAYCLGAAGGLAAAAVAGYASGLALPLILWATATALTAVAAIRGRKAQARAETEHERAMQRERLHTEAAVQREAIRAQSRIEVAQITGAWQARAAAITAASSAHRVDQIDPQLLALSPEAQAALRSPSARLALQPTSQPTDMTKESESCEPMSDPQPVPAASPPRRRAS